MGFKQALFYFSPFDWSWPNLKRVINAGKNGSLMAEAIAMERKKTSVEFFIAELLGALFSLSLLALVVIGVAVLFQPVISMILQGTVTAVNFLAANAAIILPQIFPIALFIVEFLGLAGLASTFFVMSALVGAVLSGAFYLINKMIPERKSNIPNNKEAVKLCIDLMENKFKNIEPSQIDKIMSIVRDIHRSRNPLIVIRFINAAKEIASSKGAAKLKEWLNNCEDLLGSSQNSNDKFDKDGLLAASILLELNNTGANLFNQDNMNWLKINPHVASWGAEIIIQAMGADQTGDFLKLLRTAFIPETALNAVPLIVDYQLNKKQTTNYVQDFIADPNTDTPKPPVFDIDHYVTALLHNQRRHMEKATQISQGAGLLLQKGFTKQNIVNYIACSSSRCPNFYHYSCCLSLLNDIGFEHLSPNLEQLFDENIAARQSDIDDIIGRLGKLSKKSFSKLENLACELKKINGENRAVSYQTLYFVLKNLSTIDIENQYDDLAKDVFKYHRSLKCFNDNLGVIIEANTSPEWVASPQSHILAVAQGIEYFADAVDDSHDPEDKENIYKEVARVLHKAGSCSPALAPLLVSLHENNCLSLNNISLVESLIPNYNPQTSLNKDKTEIDKFKGLDIPVQNLSLLIVQNLSEQLDKEEYLKGVIKEYHDKASSLITEPTQDMTFSQGSSSIENQNESQKRKNSSI